MYPLKNKEDWFKTAFLFMTFLLNLVPNPSIAKPLDEPVNVPFCYMVTSQGKMVDLTYMCRKNQKAGDVASSTITVDDICAEFANRWLSATTQFQKDEAQSGLDTCKNNHKTLEWAANYKLK